VSRVLCVHEAIDKILEPDSLGRICWRHAASKTIVFLGEPALQRALRVIPRAEVVDFAENLLSPLPDSVRGEGYILMRLLWTDRLDFASAARRRRMRRYHAIAPTDRTAQPAAVFARRRPFLPGSLACG
jgi:hypothetical protein